MSTSVHQGTARKNLGFASGTLIGALGGMIGLGGAEFRLPILIGMFRLATLEALILNKAISLVVVMAALIFRSMSVPIATLLDHLDVMLNLLAGSLVGAWWAAGHIISLPRRQLNRMILVVLVALAIIMLTEAVVGVQNTHSPLIEPGLWRMLVVALAGLGIGMVAALLGVAGGELLIPTIVLLYGLDIKLAGSLSLMVSLPTMLVGFSRYARSQAFEVFRRERPLAVWMATGSLVGAALGSLLLGHVPARWLTGLLGIVLLISAVKTFQHAR